MGLRVWGLGFGLGVRVLGFMYMVVYTCTDIRLRYVAVVTTNCTHTDRHTHIHTHTDTHTDTQTHRHAQTHTDTHRHTHIHTLTRTHAGVRHVAVVTTDSIHAGQEVLLDTYGKVCVKIGRAHV